MLSPVHLGATRVTEAVNCVLCVILGKSWHAASQMPAANPRQNKFGTSPIVQLISGDCSDGRGIDRCIAGRFEPFRFAERYECNIAFHLGDLRHAGLIAETGERRTVNKGQTLGVCHDQFLANPGIKARCDGRERSLESIKRNLVPFVIPIGKAGAGRGGISSQSAVTREVEKGMGHRTPVCFPLVFDALSINTDGLGTLSRSFREDSQVASS